MLKSAIFDGSVSPQSQLVSFDTDVEIHRITAAGNSGNPVVSIDTTLSYTDIWNPSAVAVVDHIVAALYLGHEMVFTTAFQLRKGNPLLVAIDGSGIVVLEYTPIS